MTRMQRIGLLCILLSGGISFGWGSFLERTPLGVGMVDFKAVYYGARCLIDHSDPYKEGDFLSVYQKEGGGFPSDPALSRSFHRGMLFCINLPTSLVLIAPLARLPWNPAYVSWMILVTAGLILSAYLMWDLARNYAPRMSLFLICFSLANSEVLVSSGNLAGVAVSLCLMAVWCFLKEQFVAAGIVCLAISLSLKPHDAGFVWLYFLLASAYYRRLALHTLVVISVLGIPAILWVSHVAPHWFQELHSNLAATSARGDLNDPGPSSLSGRTSAAIIDLQTIVSVFRDDPQIYNPVSYLICLAPLVVWSFNTMKWSFSPAKAWLGLATIAPLTLLATYHRPYDAKLLLLTIPACAMLWAAGGPIAWIALVVSAAGIVLTGDLSLAILVNLTKHLPSVRAGLPGEMLTVILTRPAPIFLLAMAIFYLWSYMRYSHAQPE